MTNTIVKNGYNNKDNYENGGDNENNYNKNEILRELKEYISYYLVL